MESESDLSQVRMWAYYAGILCPPYGEIPDSVMQPYQKAHRNAPISLAELRQPPFLPNYSYLCSLVVRTDFSDESAWREVIAAVRKPTSEGFEATINVCQDRAFADLTPAQLLGHLPDEDGRLPHRVLFIVDALTIRDPEHPLIAVDLAGEPIAVGLRGESGSWLRVIPSGVQSVGDNMNLGNMWFWEFVSSADHDGVFRSF